MPTVRRHSRRLIKPEVNRSFGKGDNYKFYNSTRWRKLSKLLKSQSPLCVVCLFNNKVKPCSVTDHIIPVEHGGAMTDLQNLTTLCHSCHNKKSAKEKRKALYQAIDTPVGMVPNPNDKTLSKIFPHINQSNEKYIYSSFNVDIGGGVRSN